jgi:hypothetical protein
VQTENEKAVRDQFEQEMGPRLIGTLGTLAMQRYNGGRKDRYIFQDTQLAWEAWQAALQSQVSNTDVLEKIVKVADEQPFCSIGHIVEHVVPEIRDALAAPKAPQQVSNTDGWVMVPVEPTQAMHDSWMYGKGPWSERYRAMLSAAPTPPQQEQSGEVTPEQAAQMAVAMGFNLSLDGKWILTTLDGMHVNELAHIINNVRLCAASATPTATASQESAPGQEVVASEIFKSYMKNCEDLRIAPDLYGAFQYAWDSAIAIHPTSTAIAAMVIKQAAEICREAATRFLLAAEGADIHSQEHTQLRMNAGVLDVAASEILALTPANAEAELEALMMKVAEAVDCDPLSDRLTIVRRVLDEKKGK